MFARRLTLGAAEVWLRILAFRRRIKGRSFNLDIKNPNALELTHEDPDELLKRHGQAKAAVADIRDQLRRALSEALSGQASRPTI